MGTDEEQKYHQRFEIVSTILLALATLAVTWCTYQSALWNSTQTFRLARFNFQSRLAQQYAGEVDDRRKIDAAIAIDFMEAVIEKRQATVDYYLTRARPDFRNILQLWLEKDPLNNKDAPPHPLVMQEYGRMIHELMAPSDSVSNVAAQTWKQAREANAISDRYVMTTVIFSLVMFLVAVSTKMSNHLTIRIVTIVAGSIYLLTLILLFFMPVRWND